MRFWRVVVCLAVLAVPAMALAQPSQPPQPPPGFTPLSEVPPEEQIPAFTLVAVAYAFVWAVLMGYVWSVAKRLRKVERDLSELEQRRT